MISSLQRLRFEPADLGLAAVFAFAVFAPTFRAYLGTQGAILVNGGLLALLAGLLFNRGKRIPFLSVQERTIYGIITACFLYYLAAIASSTLFLSQRVIMPDLYELHKPFLHFLSFTAPFAFVTRLADVERTGRLLRWCFAGIVSISILQALGVPGLGELYTKEANLQAGRVTAPFGNPYDYAFVMSFYVYFFSLRYATRNHRVSFVWALLAMGLVTVSQSRTNVIVLAGALVVLVPFALVIDRWPSLRRLGLPTAFRKYGLIAATAAAGAVFVITFFGDDIRYLIGGIERLLVEGQQSSLNERLRQLDVILESASADIRVALFGNGVSKSVMPLVESTYAFFLFRYGFVGFVVVFVLPLAITLWVLGRLLAQVQQRDKYMAMSIFVWFAALPVASIGNNFTEQPKLSFLFYFFMGFGIRYYFIARAETRPTPRSSVAAGSSTPGHIPTPVR